MSAGAMRAAVFHGPGDVRVERVDAPAAPGAGEIVLTVLRAAICGTDCAEYRHGPVLVPLAHRHPVSGHVGPLILGHEFAGIVDAVGDGVTGLRTGDRVVSGAGVSCGTCRWCRAGRTNLCARYFTIGLHAHGGLAERVRVPASTCLAVPASCSHDHAALAQPLAVGIHAVARGGVAAGQDVAVIGVGGIGAFVVAAAAGRRARRIVAIDVDPEKLELGRRLGATDVVDARHDDPAATVAELTGGDGVDVALEASGTAGGPATAIALTRRGGTMVVIGLQPQPVALDLLDVTVREIDVRSSMAHVLADDLPEALALLADGRLGDAVCDRVIGLDALVPEGLEALASGAASGKIVVDPWI
ncbi:MAG TPA: alcohol dehydrogenase catalytic domain-containing protein [Baekduia sp.]|jgi:threonine dehydrogenase-like Zn-dependent dehydrogenase|nr:alcohol dehydrogenase catalytic domain-containing protein [Baekduia sp.]